MSALPPATAPRRSPPRSSRRTTTPSRAICSTCRSRPTPPADLLRRIIGFAERGERKRVAYVNAHVINQSFDDPRGARARCTRSDLVYCDGYGVRLAAKAIGLPGAAPHDRRGLDLGRRRAVRGRGPVALPARAPTPGASAEAATELKRWYPSLRDHAAPTTATSSMGSPHDERVLEHIDEHKPDILLVGMGTPQQELWVRALLRASSTRSVVWTVGALFDYVSGRIQRAPHWMSDNGLEWIFRLAVEPRRMWRRYLLGNPVFLHRVLEERRRRTNGSL